MGWAEAQRKEEPRATLMGGNATQEGDSFSIVLCCGVRWEGGIACGRGVDQIVRRGREEEKGNQSEREWEREKSWMRNGRRALISPFGASCIRPWLVHLAVSSSSVSPLFSLRSAKMSP